MRHGGGIRGHERAGKRVAHGPGSGGEFYMLDRRRLKRARLRETNFRTRERNGFDPLQKYPLRSLWHRPVWLGAPESRPALDTFAQIRDGSAQRPMGTIRVRTRAVSLGIPCMHQIQLHRRARTFFARRHNLYNRGGRGTGQQIHRVPGETRSNTNA